MTKYPSDHNYSDSHLITSLVPCYSIHEVLSEKLRALLQRKWGEARDYYDIWYLKNNTHNLDWELIKNAFKIKCGFKYIAFDRVDDFFKPERLKQVNASWESRLKHQLPQALDKSEVMEDLKLFLDSIFSK